MMDFERLMNEWKDNHHCIVFYLIDGSIIPVHELSCLC